MLLSHIVKDVCMSMQPFPHADPMALLGTYGISKIDQKSTIENFKIIPQIKQFLGKA